MSLSSCVGIFLPLPPVTERGQHNVKSDWVRAINNWMNAKIIN